MMSNAAMTVSGTSRGAGVAGAEPSAAAFRPQRHLRVLPPPAAYVTGPRPERSRMLQEPAPRLRLTARGRRLAVVLALALGVGLIALGDAVAGGDEDGLELMGTSSVVVERGDTLWAIAGSVAGDQDVREVVDRIVELNALDGGRIEPGQVLQLP